MTTLIEHVESLSRYCEDTPDEILWSILHNDKRMDDDTLMVYAINYTPFGNELVIIWGSGNGDKLYQWTKELKGEHDCKTVTLTTTRWKAMCRRFKMKPVLVMLEREGDL